MDEDRSEVHVMQLRGRRQDLLTDSLVVLQIRPASGQPHSNVASSNYDLRRDLDQTCPPSTRVSLAERIRLSTLIVVLVSLASRQGFLRNFRRRRNRRRIRDLQTQTGQQIVGEAM